MIYVLARGIADDSAMDLNYETICGSGVWCKAVPGKKITLNKFFFHNFMGTKFLDLISASWLYRGSLQSHPPREVIGTR